MSLVREQDPNPERVTGIYPTFPTIATVKLLSSSISVEMLDPWVGHPL
jgi:hypothetical protein